MDVNNLNTGEKVAGASGIALLLIMFLFSWFTFEGGFGGDVGLNAFESFGLIDLVLLVAAGSAIALAVVAASQSQVDLPVALSTIVAGLGILGVVLVVFRLISPPDFGLGGFDLDAGRGIGVFLGLIAIGGVAAGGWMAMQEEGASFGDAGGAGAAPPPAGGGGAAPPPPPAPPQQQAPPPPAPPQQQAPPPPAPPQQPPPQ